MKKKLLALILALTLLLGITGAGAESAAGTEAPAAPAAAADAAADDPVVLRHTAVVRHDVLQELTVVDRDVGDIRNMDNAGIECEILGKNAVFRQETRPRNVCKAAVSAPDAVASGAVLMDRGILHGQGAITA